MNEDKEVVATVKDGLKRTGGYQKTNQLKRRIANERNQITDENDDIIVGKVNVDEEMGLAQAFGIQSIPTVILFKDGKPVKQSIGFASKEKLEKMWK